MLEEILNIIPIEATPNHISIMTSFEKAAMNAFEKNKKSCFWNCSVLFLLGTVSLEAYAKHGSK